MSRYRCFTVDFTDLVRPEGHCVHYAAQLEVFRWMMRTGDAYRGPHLGRRWPPSGMREAPNTTSSVNNRQVHPLRENWEERLRKAFARVILGGLNDSVARWRKDYGVAVYRRKTIYAPTTAPMRGGGERWDHWSDSFDFAHRLDWLLKIRGRLRQGPNRYHKRAISVHGCLLDLTGAGAWRIRLDYGYASESSSWFLEVAIQKKGEALPRFLKRAETELAALMRAPKETP